MVRKKIRPFVLFFLIPQPFGHRFFTNGLYPEIKWIIPLPGTPYGKDDQPLSIQRRIRRRIAYLSLAGLVSGLAWWNWPEAAPLAQPAAPIAQPTPPPVAQQAATGTQESPQVVSVTSPAAEAPERSLQIDQELEIPAADGLLHTVAEGDTIWDVATLYSVDADSVIRANPELSPDTLQPGQRLLVPGATPPRRTNQVVSRSGHRAEPPAELPLPRPDSLLWPVSGTITDYFGWRTHPVYGTANFHEGIDIAVAVDTPVRAVAAGTVTLAEWYGGYGLTVRIDHGGGLVSRYSHNDALLVTPGDSVQAGQVVARSGNTGVSTGPHLDFGLYQEGKPFDPLSQLPR